MPFQNITRRPRQPVRRATLAAWICTLLVLGWLLAGTPQDNREPLELPAGTFPVFEEPTTTTTVAVGEPPAPTTTALAPPAASGGTRIQSRDGATATATAARGTQVELEPPPATWVPGDCESFRYLLELHAPAGGWDIDRMLRYADRESGCCPQMLHPDGTWQTIRGGDRGPDCTWTHVCCWGNRSDAGFLQVNGINYDPARCDPCLHHTLGLPEPLTVDQLGDPVLNIRAAAALCTTTRSWGWGCYSAWDG